jgi:hypothetical protein
MKIKVSEATGHVLDWMVAKSLGRPRAYLDGETFKDLHQRKNSNVNWSEDWAQGGPIIERENLVVGPDIHKPKPNYYAAKVDDFGIVSEYSYGPTPLTAAMRCYSASKLGDEVEVPEDLV